MTQGKGFIDSISQDLSISVSGSTITYKYGTFTLTREASWYSYYDPDGDHVNLLTYTGMPKTTIYVNDLDDVRGYSISVNTGADAKTYSFVGSEVEVDKINGESSGTLTADCTLNDYSKNKNIKTFEIERNAGDYEIVDGSNTTHPYSYVLPYSVSGDAILEDYSSILSAVPLMVIIAILVGVVGYIFVRRE